MAVNFGKKSFYSTKYLKPGNIIQFGYDEAIRTAVVISPNWKNNCDCYIFNSLEDIPEELIQWIHEQSLIRPGDLYVDFGSQYVFKSFKLDKMRVIQLMEYVI